MSDPSTKASGPDLEWRAAAQRNAYRPSPSAVEPAPEAVSSEGEAELLHFDLRSANVARQREWDKDGGIDAAYRGNELAGEVGEACNVIKKLERERRGIRGSRATVEQLADELADVVICTDLIAMQYGIDLDAAIVRKFNATSEKVGLNTRLALAPVQPQQPDTLDEGLEVAGRFIRSPIDGAWHECRANAPSNPDVITLTPHADATRRLAEEKARADRAEAEVERLRGALDKADAQTKPERGELAEAVARLTRMVSGECDVSVYDGHAAIRLDAFDADIRTILAALQDTPHASSEGGQ